jgi:threonine aldolase
MIDLRSDTVTKPTKGMLEAMMNADVGDDVFGEDPTVNRLQEMCAEMTGKEAALFTPTGVLANQLAIKAHTVQGDEVIVESESHIFNYETAAPAVISNVQLHQVKGDNGVMALDDVKKAVRTNEYYFPRTRLICMENTHNRAGGVIIPIENIKEISGFARENGIRIHVDGARIFNASVETGISLKEYASHFDSIAFCFSKGLGTPAGSITCGTREVIDIARKWRKILGGGTRQAGFLAAAAIYALENNVQRLKEDNLNARRFAEELAKIDGFEVDLNTVQTNIVIFSSPKFEKKELMAKLKEKGVLVSSGSYENLRAVLHMDVCTEIEKVLEAFKSISN